jgi:hypothetical protein
MRSAIAGDIFEVDGKWKIYPGKWRAPVLTFTEDDLLGAETIQVKQSRDESFNSVKGTYINNVGDEVDFPEVTNATYLGEDGGESFPTDIKLEAVQSHSAAQRIGKIFLEDSRQSIIYENIFHPRALEAHQGDVVQLNIPRLGWSNKTFKVVKQDNDLSLTNPSFLVPMILKETSEAVFDWDLEENSIDIAPNTNLPDPSLVLPPSGFTAESGTNHLVRKSDGSIISRVFLSWTATEDPFVNSDGYYEVQYKSSLLSTWIALPKIPQGQLSFYLSDLNDGEAYDFRLRAVNNLGFASNPLTITNHIVEGKTEPPSDVSGFTYVVTPQGILLKWDDITDLDLDRYEIRLGSSWASATFLNRVSSNEYLVPDSYNAGTYQFKIKAFDTSENESTNSANLTVVIDGADAVSGLSASIADTNLLLDWVEPSSEFTIEKYEIRRGLTSGSYGTSTLVGYAKTTTFSMLVDWTDDNNRFYVTAIDVYQNVGSTANVDITISNPGIVQNITANVIDNTVLLRWEAPITGSLPVKKYNIYEGATFGSATLVGSADVTVIFLREVQAGNYTYWVEPVDTANQVGTADDITCIVDQPPDYLLRDTLDLDLSTLDTATNSIYDSGKIIAPVVTSETWAQHFTNNSWSTPQDQINAGFPIYIQPTNTTNAILEEKIDYGAVLAGSIIRMAVTYQTPDGSVTITPTISYSDDDVTYTDVNSYMTFATNFRYVKVKLEIEADDETSFIEISNINVRIDAKKRTDSGTANVYAADTGGTVINFNVNFLDIGQGSIVVTPQGTSVLDWVVDFTDVPNPTGFKVLLYNSGGTRVDGVVRWQAEGFPNPGA